jgi:nitrogen-specific signal transduction histidine kinase
MAYKRQIRSPNNWGVPVVFLTAYSDEDTLERAKATQPMGYLLKPFEERELYATVEIALHRHQSDLEKNRLEERLRQSEKMEAIGQLTIGLAQNFNKMLHGVIGNLDLASIDAPDDLRPFLEDAAYDAEGAAKLVRQLTLFYQQEQTAHKVVDITAMIEATVSICRETFPRKIAITV